MGGFEKFITDGGVAAWVILTMAAFAAAIVFERVRALFFRTAGDNKSFTLQIENFILSNRLDDAISACSQKINEPLAYVLKGILERSDRDDESIHQAMDVKLSEVVPPLSKRLSYLSMIANVSTLVGLLGTISGLIMAFEAVSFADPSQKQILLSQGISIAMNTTALGLSVAIPVMIAYAILNSRQNSIVDGIYSDSAKIVDHLTNRHFRAAEQQNSSDYGKNVVSINKPLSQKSA